MASSRRAQYIVAMAIVGSFGAAVGVWMIVGGRSGGPITVVALVALLVGLRVAAHRLKKRP